MNLEFPATLDRNELQLEVRVFACIETHNGAPEITIESVKFADGTEAPELNKSEMTYLRLCAAREVAER